MDWIKDWLTNLNPHIDPRGDTRDGHPICQTACNVVFVSSREMAYTSTDPNRHYAGDWFEYLKDRDRREYFLNAMEGNKLVQEVTLVFRLRAEECDEMLRSGSATASSPRDKFMDLFRFLGIALSLMDSLKKIQIYVHWTNTFQDAVYKGIGQLLERTMNRPIEHFGIVYPISDYACADRYLCPSLMDHPSLEKIEVGVMMYNDTGRILSPPGDDATVIPQLPLQPCLQAIPKLREYKARSLKEHGSGGLGADDPDSLVTDKHYIMKMMGGGTSIFSEDYANCFVKDPISIYQPPCQDASTMTITPRNHDHLVRVSFSTADSPGLFVTRSRAAYSSLANLFNKTQAKKLRIGKSFHNNVTDTTGLDSFLFGLKIRVSEICINLQTCDNMICTGICSYLSKYGHKDLHLELCIHEIDEECWEKLCTGLAVATPMSTLQLKIRDITDQQFLSGINIIYRLAKQIKKLDLNLYNTDRSQPIKTEQIFKIIELIGDKSPVEKLYISNSSFLHMVGLSQDEATQLCNLLRYNYTLCGHFVVDQKVPDRDWLESQMQSMMRLNSCGRKYMLEKNVENERERAVGFLAKIMNLGDWPHSDNSQVRDSFVLNCIYIHLCENLGSFFDTGKQKKRKRQHIENVKN